MKRAEWFLDLSFFIAILNPGDSNHERAVSLAARIKRDDWHLVTTAPVLFELADGLARRNRDAFLELIESVWHDQNTELVHVDNRLFERATKLYSERADKQWGLTDCVSFIVMEDRAITEALTADRHFEQAGFRALLREEPG